MPEMLPVEGTSVRTSTPNNIGSWPAPIKGVGDPPALCRGARRRLLVRHQGPARRILQPRRGEGDRAAQATFETKQRKAANLEPLKLQLKEMKESFGALLRLLPNRTEIEGLLVDISQAGLAAGLEFELFKPSGASSRRSSTPSSRSRSG